MWLMLLYGLEIPLVTDPTTAHQGKLLERCVLRSCIIYSWIGIIENGTIEGWKVTFQKFGVMWDPLWVASWMFWLSRLGQATWPLGAFLSHLWNGTYLIWLLWKLTEKRNAKYLGSHSAHSKHDSKITLALVQLMLGWPKTQPASYSASLTDYALFTPVKLCYLNRKDAQREKIFIYIIQLCYYPVFT